MPRYPGRLITLNDGTVLPQLGFGLGTAWYECEKGSVSRPLVDAVKTAIKVGYVHLDNAECYDNETSFGVALKESGVAREDVFITTKIATGLKGGKLRENFTSQLSKLGVTYVDLLLIHWPFELGKNGFPTHEEAWLGLEELKRDGLALSIGVSNYSIKDLERTLAVATQPISCNQIEHHPYVYEKSLPLLEFMKAKIITCVSYAPSQPITKYAGGPLDPILERIATAVSSRHGSAVKPGQILLQWNAQLGNVVLTTSAKEWRMKEQLTIIPDLTAEEMKEITEGGKAGGHQRTYMPHMDL